MNRRVARGPFALVVMVAIAVCLGACSDPPSDQRRLNTAMVGASTTLSEADSAAVSAIGLELVALGEPLDAWFQNSRPHDELLAEMTATVDRIEARLNEDRSPEVRATFAPYVAAWRQILDALEAGDQAGYDAALARIGEFDQRRVDRVAAAYGDEGTRELLESEGVDASR